MARAYYNTYAIDDEGRPIPGATVEVREIGTTTAIAETLYAEDDSVGSTTKANPFTSSADGLVEFYLDTPKIVDIFVAKTGFDSQTFRAHVQQLLPVTLTLKDSGTAETQRDNINFLDGFVLTDDAVSEETEVTLDWGLTAEVASVGAADDEGATDKPARIDHVHDHGDQSATYPDAHHDKSHAHDGVDGSGTVSHDDLTELTTGDPHTQYRLEATDHTHASTGAEAGQLDHGAAMTSASLADDDHPQYLKEKANGGVASEVPTHDHSGAGNAGTVDFADLAGSLAHSSTTGITADDHHTEDHDANNHAVLWMKTQKSATQSIGDSTNLASTTRLSWTAAGEIVNTLGVTLDDTNDRFTLPLSGVYEILLECPWESQGTVYDTLLSIRGSGGTPVLINEPQRITGANDNLDAYVQKLYVIEEFAADDVLQFHAAQSSGGARDIGSSTDSLYRVRLTIRYLGPSS